MKKFLWGIFIIGTLKAGWVIKYENKFYAPAETKTLPETIAFYISKGIIVHETKDMVFIMDLKKEELKIISHNDKSYSQGTIDEYISSISEMKSEMEEMMKERMKELPPEAKEMMEKMMGRMEPEIKIEKTDKTLKILGYNAILYKIEYTTPHPMKATVKTEMYITPDLKFVPSEINEEDVKRIEKKFEKVGPEFGVQMIGELGKGCTLKLITYGQDGEKLAEMTAISIKKGEIPGSLLKIPPGYKEIKFEDIYKEKSK